MDNETAEWVLSVSGLAEDDLEIENLDHLASCLDPADVFDPPSPEFMLRRKLRTKLWNAAHSAKNEGCDIPF
jgi:hypothetical protein